MLKANPLLLNLCSALLSNSKGHFLAPEAGKNIFKKLEKSAKIIIIFRVCICSTKTYNS